MVTILVKRMILLFKTLLNILNTGDYNKIGRNNCLFSDIDEERHEKKKYEDYHSSDFSYTPQCFAAYFHNMHSVDAKCGTGSS